MRSDGQVCSPCFLWLINRTKLVAQRSVRVTFAHYLAFKTWRYSTMQNF